MIKSFRSMDIKMRKEFINKTMDIVSVSLKDNFGKQNIIIKYKDNS